MGSRPEDLLVLTELGGEDFGEFGSVLAAAA
jgi:hypothetical protein